MILIAILAFAYYKYEKPEKDKLKEVVYYTNLTIFAEDPAGNRIKTGYVIILNNSLYDEGNTDKYGGVKQLVTTNNDFYIQNNNLAGQNYYTTQEKFYSSIPDKSNKIILNLDEYGPLNISQKGSLYNSNTINLNLTENKSFYNLMYCLKWSGLLIFVDANGVKMDNTFDDNYKCYETNKTINSKNNYILRINYNTISSLTDNDYIKVTFYDKDGLKSQNYIKRQEYYVS